MAAIDGTNFSHDSSHWASLCNGSPYHLRPCKLHRESCCLREGEAGEPSPRRRIHPTISPVTYRWALLRYRRRRREIFTGQHHQPLCPGDTANHPRCATKVPVLLTLRWCFRTTYASVGMGTWHPSEAETRHLPDSTCLAPPSPLVTLRRWLRTPPFDEFEQVVLYGYGPAQVGLDQTATSCIGLIAPFETEPGVVKTAFSVADTLILFLFLTDMRK